MFDFCPTTVGFYENENAEAMNPEFWANEGLAILEENMVVANLIHRDFEPIIARFGDVVNTRKPREFTAQRKIDREQVTVQDAITDNIPVTLNQHWHTSFIIKDGEESLAFKDLIDMYLSPAVLSIARAIDLVVSTFAISQFAFTNTFGKLGTAATKNTILGVRNVMNKNKAYVGGRWLIVTPDTETNLLEIDEFTEADKLGDDGSALREAILGRKFQFTIAMAQNQPAIVTGTTAASTTTDASTLANATVLPVTATTGAVAGNFLTVAGDMQPHLVVSVSAGVSFTVWPPIKAATTSGAAVLMYTCDTVNQTATTLDAGGTASVAGYRAGWHGWIIVDQSVTIAPEVGTLVTFGTAAPSTVAKYAVVATDSANKQFMLDRPLEIAVADGANVNYGPPGNYNWAFHKNAIALITRPLATPKQGTGALSSVVSHKGLSLRITITYLGMDQGHLVTVDMLGGVAKLEDKLGAVMFG